MARVLTTKDAHLIMNLLVKEATGQDATIQAVDSSTFVSAGETVLATGVENTLNALSMVLGRTFTAVRPYNANLRIINAINSGLYSNRLRKISYYSRDAVIDGASNTDLRTNFAPGYDNGSNGTDGVTGDPISAPSMWEQNPPVPLEMNFGGSSEWQTSTTIFEKQLQVAFRSESEFLDFIKGIMVEKGNDIESEKEAFNRMTLLNAIAGCYDLNQTGSVINMTKAYNDFYGTEYTTAQLLSTYLTSFLEFFTAEVKILSDKMKNRSLKYHWSPAKTVGGVSYKLLRHTPKDKQKLMVYNPFWIKAEAIVKPAIFNERYLDFGNFEGVDFWQNELDPSAIDVTPAIPNTSSPAEQTTGDRVQLDYVLGFLFDEDACMTDYQFDSATTTPLEARKHYRNMWWTIRKNAINDFTENMILLYMGDAGPLTDLTVEAETSEVYEVSASDIQTGIEVSNGAITGTSKWLPLGNAITDYWGAGNFITLKLTDIDPDAVSVLVGLDPSEGSGLVEIINDPDKNLVAKITNKDTQKFVVKQIDSRGHVLIQKFSLSGLTLQDA